MRPCSSMPSLAMIGTMIRAAGFDAIDIEPTRVYSIDDARESLGAAGIDVDAIAPQVQAKFISAFVRATKPAAAKDCCGPTCCTN
jgi:arsenite methyltransferase